MVDINELRQTVKEVCWPTSPFTVDELLELLDRLEVAEKERDALRTKNDRMDGAMESLLIRCDDSDSVMYGTLSTSFVRDTVRIAREALEELK